MRLLVRLLVRSRNCTRWHDSDTRSGCLYADTRIRRQDVRLRMRLIARSGSHTWHTWLHRSRCICHAIPRRLDARTGIRHSWSSRHARCWWQGVMCWSRRSSRSVHPRSTMVHSWRWSRRWHTWWTHAWHSRVSADTWMTRMRRDPLLMRRHARMTWCRHTWMTGSLRSTMCWCVARRRLWRWWSVCDANIYRLEWKLWTSTKRLAHAKGIRIKDTIAQNCRGGIVT
mmetsp:Transcript_111361/g.175498  ORF Transcript_111361/g.175498 Transcript_111361/m.175498 type:complete len:227 (+) Transcript_111361:646-1326(+)